MKTRDILKYLFAAFLGLMTILSISVLLLARHNRQQISQQDAAQVKNVINVYGEGGALPEKLEMPQTQTANGAASR